MKLVSGKFEVGNVLTPNSMAQTIERALLNLVPLGENEDPMGRRKLVLAIARGVCLHLRDNGVSVHVTVPNVPGPGTHQENATIDVDLGGWS